MGLTAQQSATLRLHRQVDQILANGFRGRFISGYQTTHPFVRRYMNGITAGHGLNDQLGSYTYAEDQLRLMEAIRTFHRQTDGIDYSPQEILVSAGSSPLITAIMTFLHTSAGQPLYYSRPLYHTFYFFADVLGLRLVPLGEEPLWDSDTVPVLPGGKQVLLLADPIWFAGRAVGSRAIDALRGWQLKTGSTIIVDGTFQYLNWDSTTRQEGTVNLARNQTIRLVCPTKSLAVHGVRFAYILGPPVIVKELKWLSENVTGSSSVFDLNAAIRLMEVLSAADSNWHLIEYIRTRYRDLVDSGYLASVVREPNCSYYVFGRLGHRETIDLAMGPAFFDLSGHDGLVRVNLLSPDIKLNPFVSGPENA